MTRPSQRVDALLACGRHLETVAELEELTAEHPLRERFWAQRLLALYRCGRQADALRAYRDVRTVLVGQLGIEPGLELRQLEARILRQDSRLEYGDLERPAGDDTGRPVTRYVDSGGVHIAYQVLGRGPARHRLRSRRDGPTSICCGKTQKRRSFFRRLSTLGRLILFDKRDTGFPIAPRPTPRWRSAWMMWRR